MPNHQLNALSEKVRFGSETGWDGSTMVWVELNDVEVSSRA